MKKLTKEDFLKKARDVHGDKYDYSNVEYTNTRTKVCVICPEHGEFFVRPNDHLYGKNSCPKCYGNNKCDTFEFIEKAKKVHGEYYDYSKVEYCGAKKDVAIICPIHGKFLQKPNYHLSGCGCKLCGKEKTINGRKLTYEDFILKAREVHGWKYDYSKVEYIDNKTPICIICPKHGEFWQTPHHHLRGEGCPCCRSSSLETEVYNFLTKNNIKFEKEKTFEWLKNKSNLYLDFYLPEYNTAIECQGIQHFQEVEMFGGKERFSKIIENDFIKNEKCFKNGIKVIYYVKFNKNVVNGTIYEKENVVKNKKDLLKKIVN